MTLERWQTKEIWDENDYITSLELLRDNRDLAENIYNELEENTVFEHILSFEAGWLDAFEALEEKYKLAYQEVFKNI